MSQQELLKFVVSKLHELSVEFMLSGSHASSLQGEYRSTHDIDFVINLKSESVKQFLDAFSDERFYLSESAISEAIATRGMVNLLETTTGEKVDFWMLQDSPFDQSRFQRRQQIEYDDLVVFVSAPEDTILMKLTWCQKLGGSEKQINDVIQVYNLQADLLDTGYLIYWIRELDVADLWQRVLDHADPIRPPE